MSIEKKVWRGAVEQTRHRGVSCTQVAHELRIEATLLTPWKREAQTDQGNLNPCAVIDSFSKLVPGWSMRHRQDRPAVIRAVGRATWQRQGGGSVILYSDRGSQFRSGDFQRLLRQNTRLCSMSAVGYRGNNAVCEGFSGMLKRERGNATKSPRQDAAKAGVSDCPGRFRAPRMRRRANKQDLKCSAVSGPSVETG